MARVYVPKNISDNGTLLTHETPEQIKDKLDAAKRSGNEFVKLVVENGTSRGKDFTLKASLIQGYE